MTKLDPKIWTTKDGKEVAYEDLQQDHFQNIINIYGRAFWIDRIKHLPYLLEEYDRRDMDRELLPTSILWSKNHPHIILTNPATMNIDRVITPKYSTMMHPKAFLLMLCDMSPLHVDSKQE
mgnify:CR=1 FL=1